MGYDNNARQSFCNFMNLFFVLIYFRQAFELDEFNHQPESEDALAAGTTNLAADAMRNGPGVNSPTPR